MVSRNSTRRGPAALLSAFEHVLWYSRFVVLVPVLGSIAMGFAAVYLATVECVSVLGRLGTLASTEGSAADHSNGANELLATIIQATDIYLVAAILLIFGLGLYELFIDRIDPAERSAIAPRLLLIRNLDDLKERLAKTVLIVLVIEFLQYTLRVPVENALDLLYLAVGVVLVGVAIYLSGRHVSETPRPGDDEELTKVEK